MPIQVCVRFSRAFRLLGARYGVGAGVATLGQGAERGRVPGTLRDRGGLPRGAAWDALARGPDLPGLRRPGLLPAHTNHRGSVIRLWLEKRVALSSARGERPMPFWWLTTPHTNLARGLR